MVVPPHFPMCKKAIGDTTGNQQTLTIPQNQARENTSSDSLLPANNQVQRRML